MWVMGGDRGYNLTKQTIVESHMPGVDTKLASDQEPRRAELGLVDGLDLHAQYYVDRTGGDFFDAVRVVRLGFVFLLE